MTVLRRTQTDARSYATLAAAFDALPDGGRLVIPADVAIGETLVVPAGKSLWCDGGSILSTHAGAAVSISGHRHTDHKVAVEKSTGSWTGGGETTSVGVLVNDTAYSEITVDKAYSFGTGIKAGGLTGGVAYNKFHLGRIRDNIRNIHILGQVSPAGWSNQNIYDGGFLQYTSGVTAPSGSANIQIDEGMNGNIFVGTSFEGDKPDRSLLCSGSSNIFLGCRWESGSDIEFLAASARNLITHGYGMFGQSPSTATGVGVIDAGSSNQIHGPFGFNVNANVTYGRTTGTVAVKSSSTTAPTFASLDSAGDPQFQVVGKKLMLRGADDTLHEITIDASGKLKIGSTIVGTQT